MLHNELPSPFKRPMFRIASVVVGLIFLATIVFMVLMFTGNLPFSYHYEVTQTFGDVTYHEEYGTHGN